LRGKGKGKGVAKTNKAASEWYGGEGKFGGHLESRLFPNECCGVWGGNETEEIGMFILVGHSKWERGWRIVY
jgi:hypothetical protein